MDAKSMEHLTILIAARDPQQLTQLSQAVISQEYRVITAIKAQHALNCLDKEPVGIALIDHGLADMDGLTLLHIVRDKHPDVGVIMILPHERGEDYTRAIREGAEDVLTPPFAGDKVRALIEKLARRQALVHHNRTLQKQLEERQYLSNIIGMSAGMQRILQQIQQYANARSNILVTGESGSGKELIARAIHHHSKREGKPFVAVNCGAIPPETAESELFGHEAGFYPGAQRRLGKFELADGGTLFLDEVGELPQSVQVKLLRVIEEQTFERVGGAKAIQVDVRVIASTNADLLERVKQGLFREDLYYRLKVLPIHMPPLRERRDDIPLLIRHFLAESARKNERTPPELQPDAAQALLNYHWPGNVRELRNVVEGLVITAAKAGVTREDL
ncbi:MAG: sigma-54-dependent transcriptional regulator, partial [Burkholderiales bacterium]